MLSWGLLMYPQLIRELPMMITALDNFEYLKTDRISNTELKLFLDALMKELDVEYDTLRGWSRREGSTKINETVVSSLVKCEVIFQPKDLTISETLSLRSGMTRLLSLFDQFPDLRFEIKPLLDNLLEGGAIQVGGIDNEDIRDGLAQLLESIGLKLDEDDTYIIPRGQQREATIESLTHLRNIYDSAVRFRPFKNHLKQDTESETSRGSSRVSSEDDRSDEEAEDDLPRANVQSSSIRGHSKMGNSPMPMEGTIGPTVPSAQQLAAAKLLSQVSPVSQA